MLSICIRKKTNESVPRKKRRPISKTNTYQKNRSQ